MNKKHEQAASGVRVARGASTEAILGALKAHGPSSQAALSRHTGLSRATLSNVVRQLVRDGVVSLTRVNKKEALVALGFGHGAVVSLQVGARRARASLFRFDVGQRFDAVAEADPGDALGMDPARVLEVVEAACRMAELRPAELGSLAVAMQAPIDRRTGAVASWGASRLPAWKGVSLAKVFWERFAVPVVVDNDANFAALAEWMWGCGHGVGDFLYLLCAEGVGGGLVVNGRIYRGGTGIAGEVGHMVLEDTGPLCFCGSRGCLHALISERALLNSLQGSETPQTSLAGLVRSAREGDAACQRVLFEAGRRLGRAVANSARVMGPSVVAIGGELGRAGELLMRGMESSADMLSLWNVASSTRVQVAELEDAATLGGVAAALDALERGLSTLPSWMRGEVVATAT